MPDLSTLSEVLAENGHLMLLLLGSLVLVYLLLWALRRAIASVVSALQALTAFVTSVVTAIGFFVGAAVSALILYYAVTGEWQRLKIP